MYTKKKQFNLISSQRVVQHTLCRQNITLWNLLFTEETNDYCDGDDDDKNEW